VGLETALFVASRGTLTPEVLHFLFWYEAETPERLRELMFRGTSRVTVFEMLPRAGIDVGKSTKWILLANLKRHGVRVKTGARVTSVRQGRVVYEKEGLVQHMVFDNVVLASGSRPVRRLCEAAAGAGVAYSCVGDCVRPGKIGDAIHGGFLAALKI
jgi:2,4-dienoyl-CoA reductase (NADPH2)